MKAICLGLNVIVTQEVLQYLDKSLGPSSKKCRVNEILGIRQQWYKNCLRFST